MKMRIIGTAVVEADIFHRSFSNEENALFESMSRQQKTPIDTSSRVQMANPPLQSRAQSDVASMEIVAIKEVSEN
jgi:hypothetical protein